jgi:hypothetical protein
MKKQMLKRKDGSYSQRGLWDNIRAAKGSGKKPTAAMLKQERKIKKAEKAQTGWQLAKQKVKPSGVIKRKYVSEDGLYTIKTKGRPDQYPSETNPEFTGNYKKSRTLRGVLKGATPARRMVMKKGGSTKRK